MRKLPAIVFDVDGVLKLGNSKIPHSTTIISHLKTQLYNGHSIPFKILTNGGGITEEKKAQEFNRVLSLTTPACLNANDIILCHTPLKALVKEYKSRNVMTAGIGDCA